MVRARKSLTESDEFVRAAYYGLNGYGKTTCAADMARLGEVAVVAAEPGFRKGRLAALEVPTDNLQLAVSNQDPGLPDLNLDNLKKLFWDLRAEYQSKSKNAPVGVVADTWTAIEAANITRVRQEEFARATRKATEQTPWDFSEYFTDVGWFGINTAEMAEILTMFRDLPCHLVITCQEERRDKPASVGPAVTPSVQRLVMGIPDFVIRLKVMQEEDGDELIHVGYAQPHDGIALGKDRDNTLPMPMVDPVFTRVLAYARGELTVEEDPLQQEFIEAVGTGRLVEHKGKPKRRKLSEQTAA